MKKIKYLLFTLLLGLCLTSCFDKSNNDDGGNSNNEEHEHVYSKELNEQYGYGTSGFDLHRDENDNDLARFYYICSICNERIYEDVPLTKQIIQEYSCTQNEITRYTAEFKSIGKQTKDIVTKLSNGHKLTNYVKANYYEQLAGLEYKRVCEECGVIEYQTTEIDDYHIYFDLNYYDYNNQLNSIIEDNVYYNASQSYISNGSNGYYVNYEVTCNYNNGLLSKDNFIITSDEISNYEISHEYDSLGRVTKSLKIQQDYSYQYEFEYNDDNTISVNKTILNDSSIETKTTITATLDIYGNVLTSTELVKDNVGEFEDKIIIVFDYDDETRELVKQTTIHYDENDKKTTKTLVETTEVNGSSFTDVYETTYSYSSTGYTENTIYYTNANLKINYVYNYDLEGHLLNYKEINPDNSYNAYTYTYDNSYNILKYERVKYTGKGRFSNGVAKLYEYDENNNITKYTYITYGSSVNDIADKYTETYEYEYDSNKNIIKKIRCYYDKSNNRGTKTVIVYEYDSNNMEIKSSSITYNSEDVAGDTVEHEFTYDVNGNLIKRYSKGYTDNIYGATIWDYTYDDNNNLLTEKCTYIKYDKDGNETERHISSYVEYVYSLNGNRYLIKEQYTDYEYDDYWNLVGENGYAIISDDLKLLIRETTYTYSYNTFNYKQTLEYEYDENNNKIKQYYKYYDKNNNLTSNSVCKYDSEGNLIIISKTTYKDDKVNSKYEYDEIGREAKKTTFNYDSNGDVSNSYVFEYEYESDALDSSKLREIYSSYDKNNTLLTKYIGFYKGNEYVNSSDKYYLQYTYYNKDRDGNILYKEVTNTEYDDNWNETKYIYTKYDANNKLLAKGVGIYEYDSNGKKEKYTYTKEDNKGNITENYVTLYYNTEEPYEKTYYIVKTETNSDNSYTTTKWEYDENWNILNEKSTGYDADGNKLYNRIEIHEYDANGNKLKVISTSYDADGEIIDKYVLIYDANGEYQRYYIKDTNYYTWLVNKSSVEEYEYNENWNEIKYTYIQYFSSGEIDFVKVKETEYDVNWNKTTEKYTWYDAEGKVTSKKVYKYEYDSNNNITKETRIGYDEDGDVLYKDITIFDENGGSKKYKIRTTSNGTIFDYEYDENWNLIKITDTRFDSNGNVKYKLVTVYENDGSYNEHIIKKDNCEYEYDENWNCIKEIYTNSSNFKYITDYEYDSNNIKVKEIFTTYNEIEMLIGKKIFVYVDGNVQRYDIKVTDSDRVSEYEYDENWNLTKEIYTFLYDEDIISYKEVIEYEYDSNNIKRKRIFTKYDAKGNVTETVVHEYDEYEYLIKRTHTKYDAEGNVTDTFVDEYN